MSPHFSIILYSVLRSFFSSQNQNRTSKDFLEQYSVAFQPLISRIQTSKCYLKSNSACFRKTQCEPCLINNVLLFSFFFFFFPPSLHATTLDKLLVVLFFAAVVVVFPNWWVISNYCANILIIILLCMFVFDVEVKF